MIDTTLDFSTQEDPSSLFDNNSHIQPNEGVSLQELLEEFNKGEDLATSQLNSNLADTASTNATIKKSSLTSGRPSHRRMKMASMAVQNLHADLLKDPKQTIIEGTKGDEHRKKAGSLRVPAELVQQKMQFLNVPSEKDNHDSMNTLSPQPESRGVEKASFLFSGRRQGRSQTTLTGLDEDLKKVHLPKIEGEKKLFLTKAATEPKTSIGSFGYLVPENKSVGFESDMKERMFFSQVSGLVKNSTIDEIMSKTPTGFSSPANLSSRLQVIPPKTGMEKTEQIKSALLRKGSISSVGLKMESPLPFDLSKECKVDLKPGRKIVVRKRSEPQVQFQKIQEEC